MKKHIVIISNLVQKIPLIVLGIASLLALYSLYILSKPEGSSQSTAMATVALCLITGLYAWLTNRLVEANQQQLQELRRSISDTQRSRAIIFAFLADRIGAAVNELPKHLSDPGFDAEIRAGILWRPEELRELEQLAAHLGPWVAMPLVQIVNYLNWMSRRVDEVRAVPINIGFDYKKFPSDKWEIARRESYSQIAIIAKLARDEAARLEPENGGD